MSTSAAAAAARAQIQYAMNMDEDNLGRVGGSPDGNGNGNNGNSLTPKYAPSSFYADSEDSFATAHSHYSSRSQSLPLGDIDHDDDLLALGGGDDAEDCSEYDVVSAHRSNFTTSSSSYLKGRTKALVLVVISVVVLCTGWYTLAAGGGDHAAADMEEEMGIVQDQVAPSAAAASAKHDKNDNNEKGGKDDGDKHHTSNANGQNSQSFPALTDLISSDGSTVKPNADISWMLDFSIAGFAKSGTTFLMNYLRRHNDETVIHKGEVHNLRSDHGAADIVAMFYDYHLEDYENARMQQKQQKQKQKQKHHKGKGNSLDSTTAGQQRRYGIKSPTELETELTLSNYATYFPSTDFIISLRHPVKWFESFYNFRQYHHYPHLLPVNTTSLIGECEPGWPYKPTCMTSCPSGKMDVCTVRANFHWALSRLGKTSMTSDHELSLLGHHEMSVVPRGQLTGRVFVMENRQIIYGHPSSQNFTVDLKHFVGLRRDLPPLEPYIPPKDKYASFSNKEAVKKLIHICDAEHAEVREELVRIGKEAATWIRQYFVKSPDVVVTAPAEFDKLLEDWGVDPCVPDSDADADANGDVDEDDGSIGGAEHGGTRWRRRWRRRRGRRHLLDELAAMPD